MTLFSPEPKKIKSLENLPPLKAIGHRFVHGGPLFNNPVLITADVIEKLESLIPLAPLHMPASLKMMYQTLEKFPVPQVAVFDTAFFHTLPPYASTYALPADIIRDYNIKRYGFHGLAHQSLTEAYAKFTGRSEYNIVTLQLGSGCSAAAVKNGEAQDTSMGFTPLEGLVMATRSGDVDPGLCEYLDRVLNQSGSETNHLLNTRSGLLGLTGHSNVKAIIDAGPSLALDIFIYRIVKYVGAYTAVLGSLDALIFSGGIGENSPYIREKVAEKLKFPLSRNPNKKVKPGEVRELGPQVFVIGSNENETIYNQVIQKISFYNF
jgi:acetate kinase